MRRLLVILAMPVAVLGQSSARVYGTLTRWETAGRSFDPVALLAHPFDSSSFFFWDRDARRLTLARAGTDTLELKAYEIPVPFDRILLLPDERNQQVDVLFVQNATRAIIAASIGREDSIRATATIQLDRAPQHVRIADMNLDGRADLLVFDEQEPGIVPIFRRGPATWQKGRLIAQDVPVRAVAELHLNNDGLLDLLAFDWVSNAMHLLFGVGRERFLDQGGFPISGGCDEIFVDPVGDVHPLRVSLYDRGEAAFTFLEMDERGDLQSVSGVGQVRATRGLHAVHDEERSALMFVAVSDSSLTAVTDPFRLTAPVLQQVGLPGVNAGSAMLRDDGVLCLLADGSLVRLEPLSKRPTSTESFTVSTGRRPVGAAGGDFNHDGRADIAVVSGEKGTLTFLWGTGDGSFGNAESYALSPGAVSLTPGRSTDSTVRLYISYGENRPVSAVEVNVEEQSLAVANIPTEGITSVLGEFATGTGAVAFSAVHQSADFTTTFSTYERIDEATFLEESFAIGLPSRLYGATLGKVDNDDRQDIIFAYRPDDSSSVTLGVVYGDTTLDHRRGVGTEFPVVDVRRTYLWVADVDRNGSPDVIAVFPRAEQKLYLLRSVEDSLFVRAEIVDTTVRIDDRSRFVVEDADGDGSPDLLAIVPPRGGLGWWKNRGDGTFAEWQRLIVFEDLSAFTLVDLDGDGLKDICAAREQHHTLEVRNGRILPWGKGR